jgi:hypothetical protein
LKFYASDRYARAIVTRLITVLDPPSKSSPVQQEHCLARRFPAAPRHEKATRSKSA